MGYYVDEIKIVSQYAVINFKDLDGTIIKSVRCMINENIDIPYVLTDMDGILDPITLDKTYYFTGGWKNSNNQIVTSIVASGPDDYFADLFQLKMHHLAVMETDSLNNLSMIAEYPFKIFSNKRIFLGICEMENYTVYPNINHSYDSNGEIINDVTFAIDGMQDHPDQVTSIEPVFTVFKDINLTQNIGTIKIEIRVYHSTSIIED